MQDLLLSYLETLSYQGVGLAVLLIGTLLFVLKTKMNDFKLILEEGNTAVAVKLIGHLIGVGIVMYGSLINSVSLLDFTLWAAYGVIVQIVSYFIVEYVFFFKVSLIQKVEEGNVAVALFLMGISIAIALIVAGSLTYDPIVEIIQY